MVTSGEAFRLGKLRIAVNEAENSLNYFRKSVVKAEQEVVKTKAQFGIHLTSLLENSNESGIRA